MNIFGINIDDDKSKSLNETLTSVDFTPNNGGLLGGIRSAAPDMWSVDAKITEKYQKQGLNFNPEDYYTKALGFLPIDTRYLSNTTNSLAYNSMADVFLNRGAQIKRYGYDSWLNTWYGYIPRVVADTALLLKEQTLKV